MKLQLKRSFINKMTVTAWTNEEYAREHYRDLFEERLALLNPNKKALSPMELKRLAEEQNVSYGEFVKNWLNEYEKIPQFIDENKAKEYGENRYYVVIQSQEENDIGDMMIEFELLGSTNYQTVLSIKHLLFPESRSDVDYEKYFNEKAELNNQLSGALKTIMAVSENYPDLKANENFINLSDELAGTENRIANARVEYNDAVEEYTEYAANEKKFFGINLKKK